MLTEKKRLFVDYFHKTKNATQSARLAGYASRYASRQGSRLLHDVEVRQRLDLINKAETEYACSRVDYLKECRTKIDTCDDASVKARYFELLGKVLGYVKNTNDNVQSVSIVNIEDLSKIKVNQSCESIPVANVTRVSSVTDTPVHTSSNSLPAIELQQPSAPENNVT